MVKFDHGVIFEPINPHNVLSNPSGPKETNHKENLKQKIKISFKTKKFPKVSKWENLSIWANLK